MNVDEHPELEVFLLGSPHLRRAGAEWKPALSTKAQALLYYLLATEQPQTRTLLATLLWGDHRDDLARTNLRKVLAELRKQLAGYLLLDGNTIALRDNLQLRVDVAHFLDLTEQMNADAATLAQAVACYRGDFLSGFYVRNAPDYELWQQATQSHLRAKLLHCLEQLLEHHAARGKLTQAIGYAERIVALEPWREETQRRLMELLAENGERARALRQYELCRVTLRTELGVEPAEATQQLYARLVALDIAANDAANDAANERSVPEILTSPDFPLIGRVSEWRVLLEAWRRSASQGPHLVVISGEAGIGKTRLAEELLLWVARQGNATAHTRSYAAGGQLAYAPVIDWLRSAALQPALSTLDALWLSEVARLLPELLLARPEIPQPAPLNERWQRQRLFEALTRLFLLAPGGSPSPLLLVIDDLQWCDVDTLEWLGYLLHVAQRDQADPHPTPQLLVVGTARSDEVDMDHPLHALLLELRRSGQVSEISLSPLSAAESAELAAHVVDKNLDETESARLYTQTEGSPLFIVESLRAGIGDESVERRELSRAPQSPIATLPSLSPKVQAVIEYRLAHLSPAARELVAIAATIGRSFTFALLQGAGDHGESEILRNLDELWQRGIVRSQGSQTYDFSHDRIREVAYGVISPVRRPMLHRRVARALEAVYVDDLDPVSAQLALHYERAGSPAQGIHYCQRVAEIAAHRFDHAGVVELLDAGLALQELLPRTTKRTEQQFAMLLAKAESMAVFRGFAVPEMVEAHAQLEALLPRIEQDDLRFQGYQRLRAFYGASGKMEEAYRDAEYALDLAHRLEDPILLAEAYPAIGVSHLQLGQFAIAQEQLQQGETSYKAMLASPKLPKQPAQLSPTILSNLAFVLWFTGYPKRASAKAFEAIALAEKFGNPMQLCIAIFFMSMVERYNFAVELVAVAAKEMSALGVQNGGIQTSRVEGKVVQGWVWTQQGRLDEGIAQMRAGIDEFKAANHTMFQTHRLGWLAETQLQAGHLADAASTLEEGFALAESSGQRSNDAELQRLHGELMMQLQRDGDAETSFRQAIEIARSQEAKSLELRAAMSLARLWQRQGKRAAAHARLAELYGWFSEGFETADLQAAQALLAELAATT